MPYSHGNNPTLLSIELGIELGIYKSKKLCHFWVGFTKYLVFPLQRNPSIVIIVIRRSIYRNYPGLTLTKSEHLSQNMIVHHGGKNWEKEEKDAVIQYLRSIENWLYPDEEEFSEWTKAFNEFKTG